MKYEKNIKLSKIDEKDFKNLLANRETYIDSGDNSITSPTSALEKLTNQISITQETFYVKKKEAFASNSLFFIILNYDIHFEHHLNHLKYQLKYIPYQ